MCGIGGAYHFNKKPVDENGLNNIVKTLHHRGPDANGVFVDESLGLTHNRLSIIDLSENAAQPMRSKDGRYVLSFNGEVYNFKELRKELKKKGATFRSDSDSEVVLQSLIINGTNSISSFNGMFAFAFFDTQTKELILGRDRYGIKPLYYQLSQNELIFSSETKGILAYQNNTVSVDKEALLEYFTFQNIFTNKTFFQHVHLFPPGHYMTIDPDGKASLQEYWDYHFQETQEVKSEGEYVEEFDHLFRRAVQRQLVSDVEIGSYLSGGMDSGSITALASIQFPYIKTFTCGFDMSSISGLEIVFDERAKAEHMSYLFKTEHYEMVLKSGDMERVLPSMAYHLEEPRVGQSYPNFYAAKLASKFVKVVFSGTGGDELFAGYPWRYYRATVNQNFEDYIDKYYLFWQRLIPNKEIHNVFSPIWNDVKQVWTRDIFRDVFNKDLIKPIHTPEDYINHSLYFETKTFLPGLLMVEDKLSMAHSLESRVPFLDNDLVDFAMRVPLKYKLGNLKEVSKINENEAGKLKKYFEKTKDGKLLMRKAMRNYIPNSVTDREKQGFSAPDASWFKGNSIEYVTRIVKNKNAAIYNYMDYQSVNKLVDEHLSGDRNRRLFIWSLLYFENWNKQWMQ